eukprot:s1760_g4.t3
MVPANGAIVPTKLQLHISCHGECVDQLRAMGGSQSSEIGGFRIFKVNDGSPAAEAGLEVFFDFIVEINGVLMDADQTTFAKAIQDAENQRTKLVVQNIRTHTSRDVYVTPRRWGGAGLLGAVVRYDSLESAEGQGMRVLSIFPNSPAEAAGLVPNKDFLLGTTEVMFRDMDELAEVVNLYMEKELKVYVYNLDSESIREVILVPRTDWGGEGAIGADIRTGLLHRIPAPRRAFGVDAPLLEAEEFPQGTAGSDATPGPQVAIPRQLDPQQVNELLSQVQRELSLLQKLQTQQELSELQQQHLQQFMYMQQQLLQLQQTQGHLPSARPKNDPAPHPMPSETVQDSKHSSEQVAPRMQPQEQVHSVPNGDSHYEGGDRAEGQIQRLFQLPPAAKAAAAKLERSPFDMLAPGIIYETAVS